jgi:Na+-transporting methylmalonyl-CoA/oxaloacetate decarboxylase gamma subunit
MSDNPRLASRTVVILIIFLLICSVRLVSAAGNTSFLNNNTVSISNTEQQTPTPSSNQTLTTAESGKAKLTAIAAFQNYKENMTEWKTKLPTDLLYIVDMNFPEMGNTREHVKETMKRHNQLMYANEAIKIFDIHHISNQPVGDHVYVYIDVKASFSTLAVESLVTKVDNVIKDFTGLNRVKAWVDLNNLEKIASLNEVTGISLVDFGETSSIDQSVKLNDSVTTGEDHIQYTPTSVIPSNTFAPITTNSVSTTHVTPVSILSICAAIISAGVIVLLRRRIKTRIE